MKQNGSISLPFRALEQKTHSFFTSFCWVCIVFCFASKEKKCLILASQFSFCFQIGFVHINVFTLFVWNNKNKIFGSKENKSINFASHFRLPSKYPFWHNFDSNFSYCLGRFASDFCCFASMRKMLQSKTIFAPISLVLLQNQKTAAHPGWTETKSWVQLILMTRIPLHAVIRDESARV